jgi:hypothetical protein
MAVLESYFTRHMTRGRRFLEVLCLPSRPEEPEPYVFGGDCTPTVACLVVEREGKLLRGRERPDAIRSPRPGVDYETLINEPGDGVVTRTSLIGRQRKRGGSLLPELNIAHSIFLCEEHLSLTGNPSFQDNLLYNLLSARTD